MDVRVERMRADENTGAALAAGILSFVVTAGIVALNLSRLDGGATLLLAAEALGILGLAIGTHLKSRTCAVLLFGYFAASKAVQLWQGALSGFALLVALVMFVSFLRGVDGAFTWRRLEETAPEGGEPSPCC